MLKYLKLFLLLLLGVLVGFIIHGIIEMITIWILLHRLTKLFFAISWSVWLWIHGIFTFFTIILGIFLVFWYYKSRKAHWK